MTKKTFSSNCIMTFQMMNETRTLMTSGKYAIVAGGILQLCRSIMLDEARQGDIPQFIHVLLDYVATTHRNLHPECYKVEITVVGFKLWCCRRFVSRLTMQSLLLIR